MSFAGGTFFVEGHPCRVPYRGLNKILSRHPRISGRTQWKQLLRSIDLAATQMRMQPREGGPDSPILHPASQVVAFNVVDEFMMMEMLLTKVTGVEAPVSDEKHIQRDRVAIQVGLNGQKDDQENGSGGSQSPGGNS